ncbi:hypothetical protein [Absidia glauca]|uniref:Rho-GAP domain-containing protein n=1 Tax=Absidia glauca TaxID=4829 RepID=A0A163K3S9_ABSGL|nr:hypothetical protein [Absidia glauca]
MQRSLKASPQEDDINTIDAHLEYVKKALRWSINDLERFISLLKARVIAEELYVKSLSGISRLSSISEPEACPYFGQDKSTYELATFQYELSLDKVIKSRRDFILAMKAQIDVLTTVKDKQEQRRKTVKQHVADKNMDYTNYRTRDFIKVKKMYFSKCNELATIQQSVHDGGSSNSTNISSDSLEHTLSPVTTMDESRKSTDFDNDTDSSSISSIPDTASSHHTSSTTTSGVGNKKKMGGFMAQMRTQLAAAAAGSASDQAKQTARFAKIKKDIHDADIEYRHGVRYLEHLRKAQIETMNHAMKNVEVVFLDKAEATRSVLTSILNNEHATLLREASLIQGNKTRVESINPQLDVSLFKSEYQKKHFTNPEQIFYESYYNGVYKGKSNKGGPEQKRLNSFVLSDVLFGSSLDEYTLEHQRTVPLIVSKCIDAIEQMGGLQKEGIYRISGRQTNVDMLKTEFEKNEESCQPQAHYDVFTIASVLKIYLRELVVPLVPYSVSDRLIYSTVQNLQQRLAFLQHKISELSQSRRDTLKAVVCHLERVNAHAEINKMNLQNLSYMFTPAIFHDHNQAEHPGEWRSDLVFEDLVLHHDFVFAPIPRQQQQKDAQQRHRLSQQPQDATSPSTPVVHGQPNNFKDSPTAPDLASGPVTPSKSTNSTPSIKSRSRSSTLSQLNPPSTVSASPSVASLPKPVVNQPAQIPPPLASSESQSNPSIAPPQPPPLTKMHSFNAPLSTKDPASGPAFETVDMSKTHSSPSTPSTEQQRIQLDSPSPPSEPPKSQGGILRRATLKARNAIPPRQQSLRSKHGRPSVAAAPSEDSSRSLQDIPSSQALEGHTGVPSTNSSPSV